MQQYKNKQELIDEINKQADLFINEFKEIKNKDTLVEGIDRTPSQMISYQLGWMNLVLLWEQEEQKGNQVIMPVKGYKWNNLGQLYQTFYKQYENDSLEELTQKFLDLKEKIITLIESYTEEQLFETNQRAWASSTPSNWPIWKWIHINTVAPFKSFRIKIRKWKKII